MGTGADIQVAPATAGGSGITQLTADVTAGPGSGSKAAALVATANVLSVIANSASVIAATATANAAVPKDALVYNVKDHGAKVDAITNSAADGHITSGLAVFTSATAIFAAGDVGKAIIVQGAGVAGAQLTTTILSRQSATQVTLNSTASTTVTTSNYNYGTDDTAAIQSVINLQQLNGGVVFLPAGYALIMGATTGCGLVPSPGAAAGPTWTNATIPLVIRGVGAGLCGLLSGNTWNSGGLFGIGTAGVTPAIARLDFADFTLDGNYLGSGGTLPQDVGSLISEPWPFNTGIAPARNGQYHLMHRMRFYRPTGYGTLPTQGMKLVQCETLNGGQPAAATHKDNFGSNLADLILIEHTWKDSTGNYVDFIPTVGQFCRLVMIGCQSFNHTAGGVYGGGQGSIVTENSLDSGSGGIGYDAGNIATKSANIVANNNCPAMSVYASGLDYFANGDLVSANVSSDQPAAGLYTSDAFFARNSFSVGTVSHAPNAASKGSIASDGANLYVSGNGGIFLRPNGYTSAVGQVSVGATGIVAMVATSTASGATYSTPTLANSAVGSVLNANQDVMLYLEVTTVFVALVISMGPAATPTNAIFTSAACPVGTLISLRVPAGWFVATSYTSGAFHQAAVSC